jgi:preprotein translocase subunit YajC
VFVILPQRRRSAATIAMQDDVAIGDEIVTAGGLYGIVTALRDDEVRLEIAPGTEVRVARRAIAGVMAEDEDAGDAERSSEPEESR